MVSPECRNANQTVAVWVLETGSQIHSLSWHFAVSDFGLRGVRLWRFAVSDFVFCVPPSLAFRGVRVCFLCPTFPADVWLSDCSPFSGGDRPPRLWPVGGFWRSR